MDLQGETHRPFAQENVVAAVVVFVAIDCPIANAYQPSLRRLQTAYADRGIAFFQVHADPDLTNKEASEHAEAYEIRCPVVLDKGQRLARRLQAERTPEAFVITRKGEVAYRGRIDDLYTALGKRRPKPTRSDLKLALEAVLQGKEVEVPRTEAVGCQLFYEEPEPREGVGSDK